MAPAAVAAVAMVAAAAGSMVAAYASIESGQAQKKAANYNAALQERQAENEKAAAAIQEENFRKQTAARMATLRTGYAASGVEISEGTPLLVAMESQANAEKDALRIRWGGETQADAFLGAATLSRAQGSQAQTAGYLGAGASLLSGAGRVAGIYGGYQTRQSLIKPS